MKEVLCILLLIACCFVALFIYKNMKKVKEIPKKKSKKYYTECHEEDHKWDYTPDGHYKCEKCGLSSINKIHHIRF